MERMKPILPGQTVGVLGSGQLGRMLALEARRMGVRVHVFSPGKNTPTGQVADVETTAVYDDLDAVRQFASSVDVVTYEFENVPLATAVAAQEIVPVRPGPQALAVAQNRLREKQFMRENGLPVAPHTAVESLADLKAGLAELSLPAVLKTAESGYDGKGQVKIEQAEEAEEAWQAIGQNPAVLEAWIPFEREVSVVGARDVHGKFAHYGLIENEHVNHILDVSLSPATVPEADMNRAVELAKAVLEQLDVVGVLCVEFFLTAEGDLLINEIAPRPHNSGHLTIESHATSQFAQQLRTVCGWPLGSTEQLRPAAMANLLGDLWPSGGTPNWSLLGAFPQVKLHLYGKETARPGRKMGHLTALGNDVDEARTAVTAARAQLARREERKRNE